MDFLKRCTILMKYIEALVICTTILWHTDDLCCMGNAEGSKNVFPLFHNGHSNEHISHSLFIEEWKFSY